ncbi:hypothetical protein BS78_08G002800 [Paspalum vaginatum]|nr:hypothetical protein BS78_08G002800 [Paspalum vaginatum]
MGHAVLPTGIAVAGVRERRRLHGRLAALVDAVLLVPAGGDAVDGAVAVGAVGQYGGPVDAVGGAAVAPLGDHLPRGTSRLLEELDVFLLAPAFGDVEAPAAREVVRVVRVRARRPPRPLPSAAAAGDALQVRSDPVQRWESESEWSHDRSMQGLRLCKT